MATTTAALPAQGQHVGSWEPSWQRAWRVEEAAGGGGRAFSYVFKILFDMVSNGVRTGRKGEHGGGRGGSGVLAPQGELGARGLAIASAL